MLIIFDDNKTLAEHESLFILALDFASLSALTPLLYMLWSWTVRQTFKDSVVFWRNCFRKMRNLRSDCTHCVVLIIMFTFIVTGRGRPGHDQHPSPSHERSLAEPVEVNSERERYTILYMQQDLGGDKMHFPETLLKELLCCKLLPTKLILHLKMELLKTPPALQRRLFGNQDQSH